MLGGASRQKSAADQRKVPAFRVERPEVLPCPEWRVAF
jgi:hypothetical protein